MLRIIFYIIIYHLPFLYGNVISVTSFKNNTPSEYNNWIGEMLADNLTTNLSNFNSLQIINRTHLKDILKEQELSYSGVTSDKDQIILGELIGAKKILRGDYTILNNILIINTVLIDIESGQAENSVKIEGAKDDIYVLEKQLTYKVLKLLGIELDEIEKLKIAKYETDKVDAIEKNYMGVLAMDRNEVLNAISLFKEAVVIDPNYLDAKTNLKSSQIKISGGLLFANAMGISDKKQKQRDALKIIIDTFIQDYIIVEIAGQEVVTDLDNPDYAFIEIKLKIDNNFNALKNYINGLKNISEGGVELFREDLFSKYYYSLLPHDIAYLLKSIGRPLNLQLYKENVDWADEYITTTIKQGYSPRLVKYAKSYIIITSQSDEIMHNHHFSISLDYKEKINLNYVKNREYDFSNIKLNLISNKHSVNNWEKPPNPKSDSIYGKKYPFIKYVYLKVPVGDLKKITSIALE